MSLNRFDSLKRLSSVRQAIGFLLLFSAISIVAWGGTYLLVNNELLRSVDARLIKRMDAAIAALEAEETLPVPDIGETSEFVGDDIREGFQTIDAKGTETEMRYLVRTTPLGQLQLGEDTERQEELRDILAGGMQTSLLATLVLTALVGIWMARRNQDRLNSINAGLARVAQGDLTARIDLNGNDDLSLLANRIDVTAIRLENLMQQMRVQSSNIAHDLRTPLARLRAQVETSLLGLKTHRRPVTPDDLESALVQIDRITATFEALLRLARIESGAGRDAFAPVNLAKLADDIMANFGPVVEEAEQTLTLDAEDPAEILGDRELLIQLLANLIQNALRHGATKQEITIQVHGTRLIVADQGPGIPFEERDNMLQPLRQGQTTRQGEGFGLGLSLVRAISELHGAELSLSDGPNGCGLRVTVTFPRLKTP